MDFEKYSSQDDSQHKETLAGGGTGNIVLGDKTVYRTFIIQYSLKRGAVYEEGILRILNASATVQMLRDEQDNGDCGVTFTVNISGDNVRLGYVVTAGVDVTMNYIIRKVAI